MRREPTQAPFKRTPHRRPLAISNPRSRRKEIAPDIRCDVTVGKANGTYNSAWRYGDQDDPTMLEDRRVVDHSWP
jgi:hypothetical protein